MVWRYFLGSVWATGRAGGAINGSCGICLPNTIYTEEIVVIPISQLSALGCNQTCICVACLTFSCLSFYTALALPEVHAYLTFPPPQQALLFSPSYSPPLTLSTANRQATSWRGAHPPGVDAAGEGQRHSTQPAAKLTQSHNTQTSLSKEHFPSALADQ
ncbi:hypothetical protein BKA80DRAFT_259421 [Phyllosticta citrichinensis]